MSVIGLPGEIHNFTAKTAASGTTKGIGPFTALTVYGVPGQIHTFTGKTETVSITVEGGGDSRYFYDKLLHLQLSKDDREIMEFIMLYMMNEQEFPWGH